MHVPERHWRFPTAAAIDSLARRFGLPNRGNMQDWEIQVADPARLDEFLTAYDDGTLDGDERFTLMEMIIQSCEMAFEQAGRTPVNDRQWNRALERIRRDVDLHIYSLWYWADPDGESKSTGEWIVTPDLRKMMAEVLSTRTDLGER
ncbi:hypothetical protein [Tahibacter soli]|uniref:Uncharacterized protein n=1 Tax=Tahibacter soli TaxID=2983605 RepID=A0A9X3YGK4_9GAMM|nr:hypothetical protein [Tahibacter soli]MDC8011692.1 hypothetical protein [Tahibacter soli]